MAVFFFEFNGYRDRHSVQFVLLVGRLSRNNLHHHCKSTHCDGKDASEARPMALLPFADRWYHSNPFQSCKSPHGLCIGELARRAAQRVSLLVFAIGGRQMDETTSRILTNRNCILEGCDRGLHHTKNDTCLRDHPQRICLCMLQRHKRETK